MAAYLAALWRWRCRFLTDQLWFMTRIRGEEEEVKIYKNLCIIYLPCAQCRNAQWSVINEMLWHENTKNNIRNILHNKWTFNIYGTGTVYRQHPVLWHCGLAACKMLLQQSSKAFLRRLGTSLTCGRKLVG